jgi:uncharacterized membrane protein YtjA (UPF0391 family)
MLMWVMTFFVIAITAAVMGLGGLVGVTLGIANMLFFLVVLPFVMSVIINVLRGGAPTI